jgi:hypothetical protein
MTGFVAAFLLASPFAAQGAALQAGLETVSGRVLDAVTRAPIAGARVQVSATVANTDGTGGFVLSLPTGPARLFVSAKGYVSAASDVEVRAAPPREIEVLLVPGKTFKEEVQVSAPIDATGEQTATIPVQPHEVVSVAGGAENIFRVLQTLPGVTATDDFGSRISVRGGGPDQNLTIMDGIEVYNPFRLYGFASAFNPETVDGFELTSGAFSPRYGDRLSSLLVVETRDGATSKALTGSAAISLTDTNAIAEGGLPGQRGSWMLTARRTYYDVVAERFTDDDLPSFADVQGKAKLQLGGGRTLTFFGLRSRERTDWTFDFEKEAARGAVDSRSRNDLLAVTFNTPLGRSAWLRTTAASYRSADLVDFGGDFRDETRRSNAAGDGAFGELQLGVEWDSAVRDNSVRQELSWSASPSHVLEAGFELHRLRSDLAFTIEGGRNASEPNGSSLNGGTSLPDATASRRHDTRVGGWLLDRWQPSSRLSVEGGVRFDRSTVNERTAVTPRLSATFAVDAATRLRAGLGLHTQSPGYEKLVMGDYFVELDDEGPLPLANERARHALLSVERDLAPGLLVRLEGYYKGFDRLLVGRLETKEETAARLATYDFPAELVGTIPTESAITTFPTNDGRGHAWGFDVYAARRARSADTRLTGWASYSYGVAQREAYSRSYPFDYDRRHALSLVGSFRVTRRLEVSLTARLASGFPDTPVLGLIPAAQEDTLDRDDDGNVEELVPERDPSGLLVYTPYRGGVSNLNAGRLPFYARIDARATFTPEWGRGRVRFYLDVINVLNRKNGSMLEETLEYDATSDQPKLVREPIGGLPFFPSFGVHVDFKAPRWARIQRDTKAPSSTPAAGRLALGLQPGGTTGWGLELVAAIVPGRLNARLGGARPGSLEYETELGANEYETKLKQGSISAILDWHPFRGRFHVSAGAFATRHAIEVSAVRADRYEVGGTSYASESVGALSGTASVRKHGPYVGIGWGALPRPGKRLGWRFEIGTILQGRPDLQLAASGPAASESAFQENLAVEARSVEKDLRFWGTYPVVSGGLMIRLR